MKLLIQNGTVVNADRSFSADVLCEDGIITSVAPNLPIPEGVDRVVDATGKLVMPGGIDPHCHLKMPFMGTHSFDDFQSGTECALAGGSTMLIDFMIPHKGEGGSLLETFNTWMEKSRCACCDYSFHGSITYWNEQVSREMEILAKEKGISSFKHFLAYKGALMLEEPELVQSFQRCKELGVLPQVHAEDGELVARKQKEIFDMGITGPEGHPLSRPPELEGLACHLSCTIAESLNCPLYIVHNTCREAVEEIHRAQSRGTRVFGESVVAHLALDVSRCSSPEWAWAAAHVLSPPLREKSHQASLWGAIQAGTITVIATDHCSFNTEQKMMGRNDFRRIPNGLPGIEERLLVMWEHGVNQGRIDRNQFVALTSANAARMFNIYPRKGVIQEGSDADICIWDPELVRTVDETTHRSRIERNPFNGFTSRGAPAYTISRGVVCYENGTLNAVAGAGRFVPRSLGGYAYETISPRDSIRPTPVDRS